MSSKTTETKPEKQAGKKQPTELTEEQLSKAEGGGIILLPIGGVKTRNKAETGIDVQPIDGGPVTSE